MAVRDFADASGVNWKVWPVTPESLQPRTAAEDYLGDYGEGWLCFESHTERRRLARYPADWDALNDQQLCSLLETAAIVPARKSKYPTPPPNEPPRR
jgi:hypothetical protein